MIDVEHGALCSFEQDALAGSDRIVQKLGGIAHQRPDAIGECQILIANLLVVDGLLNVKGLSQQLLIFGEGGVHGAKTLALVQIRDANAAPPCFVFIAGADAARSGTDGDAILAGF